MKTSSPATLSSRDRARLAAATHRLHQFVAILGITAVLECGSAFGQAPVFGQAFDIDQKALLSGSYPLPKVLESGGQFWTTPFTVQDGFGEGAKGPRSAQRAAMYPNNPSFPFLRVNGLDSQSCYECHNSIGSYVPADSSSGALIRKPGSVGGSAGFNSDAFINPLFPDPLTLFVRNPPHVFGVGYVQQLAYEMTLDLRAAQAQAQVNAKAAPGVKQSIKLSSKGTDFGTYSTKYDAQKKSFVDDFTQLAGVSTDLTVRPLQWKGIASSVRHFVRDALDFHFSMQAVEKVGVDAKGNPKDCDQDGVVNEVTVGNLTAITAFVGLTRPPTQIVPAGLEKQIALGAQLFAGLGAPQVPGSKQMCATCHTPSLPLNQAKLIIETPEVPKGQPCPSEVALPALTDPVSDRSKLAVHKIFEILKPKIKPAKDLQAAHEALKKTLITTSLSASLPQSFVVDLTRPDLGSPTSYALPRLPENKDGSVTVPLFSDLKRHDMGVGLSDPDKKPDGTSYPQQGTDVDGISVPPRLFLTRPLWGVADTGPWLHDGRARSLLEAIQLHSSEGSEANDVIKAFNALTQEQKDAIIAFLLSLRLPLQQGLAAGK